ncbi:hypothetical protein JCM3765_000855 [Sporobolomyces pararoseus]
MEASTSNAVLSGLDMHDQLEDEEEETIHNLNNNNGSGEAGRATGGEGGDVDFIPPSASLGNTSKGKRKAKRTGDEDVDEEGNKKKRNRKPVTCAQCRRRKLKCDRGYPCGACRDRQEAHLCDWGDAVRLPQPHLTRDAEAQELRGQLDRFETLLKSLSAGNPLPVASTSEGVGLTNVGGTGGLGAALGAIAGDETSDGAASGANGGGASAFARPLTQLQQANATTAKSANSSHRAQLLAQASSVGHLVGLLPSHRELDVLVKRFLASEHKFLPIVHIGTFQARYAHFTHATASEDPFFLAFLFSIVSYEMGWQLTDSELSRTAGAQKEGAMKRLFEAASETLRMAGHLESPNLDVVRTLIVIHHCSSQQLDSRDGYILTQAIQVAQALGLHRDPSKVGITDCVEAEDRRRLWYILVALDALAQPGRVSIISSDQYDTQAPASAFDNEITPLAITTRPFPTFTPKLYLELLHKLGNYNSLISQSFFSVKPKGPITWSKIVDSNVGLDRLKASFPALEWRSGLVEPLPEDSFDSDRFRVLAHTTLLKLDIRVNRPFLTRGLVDARFAAGRNRVLDAAHQLLGIWLAYPDQSQVSRLWQLPYHGLNAICIIAVDLYQDPKGPRSDSHRKFWAMASGRLDRPEYKSKVAREVKRIANLLIKRGGDDAPMITPSTTAALATEEPFTVSNLPVPLTNDPFAYISPPPLSDGSNRDPELSTLWHEIIASYPAMYAIPDKKEWEEMCKPASVAGWWENGIDLISSQDQPVDQLEV